MAEETVRLTQLSHGGGCGCKIAPGLPGAHRLPRMAQETWRGVDDADLGQRVADFCRRADQAGLDEVLDSRLHQRRGAAIGRAFGGQMDGLQA